MAHLWISYTYESTPILLSDPMDFFEFSNRPLTFPANSATGTTVCTNVFINNDNTLEMDFEMFFLEISSTAADLQPGRERATVVIRETNDGGNDWRYIQYLLR